MKESVYTGNPRVTNFMTYEDSGNAKKKVLIRFDRTP